MANAESTITRIHEVAQKVDDAIEILESASEALDISLTEAELNLFFDLGKLLEGFEQLQADVQDVVDA